MSTPVSFRKVDQQRADDLFVADKREYKWAEATTALLKGQSIFIPGMTRIALETLRSIINSRSYGRLHSREMTVDGERGRLLRLDRKART